MNHRAADQPAHALTAPPRRLRRSAAIAGSIVVLILLLIGVPTFAAGDPDLAVTAVSHIGTTGDGSDFRFGNTGGSLSATIQNVGVTNPTSGQIAITFNLQTPSFSVGSFTSSPGTTFSCSLSTSTLVTCTTSDALAAGATATVTLFLNVTGTPANNRQFVVQVSGGGDTDPVSANLFTDPVGFNVIGLDLSVAAGHTGTSGANFLVGTTGQVVASVTNLGNVTAASLSHSLIITLPGGLTRGATTSTPLGAYTCTGSTGVITCQHTGNPIVSGVTELVTMTVTAPTTAQPGPLVIQASTIPAPGVLDANPGNDSATDPQSFAVIANTATPTLTLTPLPSLTAVPQPTITPTRTFIPPLPTRTPLPRPANAGQAIPIPPSGISIVVNRDEVNVRLLPAIGAEVVGYVNAGQVFDNVQARSGDNQWFRVDFAGQQAWIGAPVVSVLNGADINALPVADPRTIPYGGFEQPRAGITSVTSPITGRLVDSGLRVRGGPGRAYPVLANAPRYTIFSLLGRTADNTWWQVNFEGTLGWVDSRFVQEISSPEAFNLPVDGIIADGLPVSGPTGDSYADTLRLMLARLDLAQPSIDRMRELWNAIALGGQAQCGDYPARPSDYNIPLPLLSAFNGTLGPLETDFNRAMAAVRQAIDLFIDACSTSQPAQGLIGVGGAAIGLQAVNDADTLFADLRARLLALIPDDRVPTDNECLFTFNNNSEIVQRLISGQAILITWDEREYVRGLCFDGTAGEIYRFELVRANGDVSPQVLIAGFSDPASFIATGRLTPDNSYLGISNITIPQTGQYLIVLNDFGNDTRPLPSGDVALLLTNITGFSTSLAPGLELDEATGQVVVNPILEPLIGGADGSGSQIIQQAVTCPDATFTCAQLSSCDQARACLFNSGNLSLDPDGDGIPCEENLCSGGASTVPTVPVAPDRGGT